MFGAAVKRKFLLKTFSCRYLAILLGVILGLSSVTVCTGQKKQKLERGYRDWLKRDVAYIITKEEYDAFLRLTTDDAREEFIEKFWEIRNPTPGSPTNSYKEEIYQRIAYADAHFQIEKSVVGGRTRTSVKALQPSARVDELARMLGGNPSSTTLRARTRMTPAAAGAPMLDA